MAPNPIIRTHIILDISVSLAACNNFKLDLRSINLSLLLRVVLTYGKKTLKSTGN
jgi:hypothetical protein